MDQSFEYSIEYSWQKSFGLKITSVMRGPTVAPVLFGAPPSPKPLIRGPAASAALRFGFARPDKVRQDPRGRPAPVPRLQICPAPASGGHAAGERSRRPRAARSGPGL